jgi:hypothetical protein
VVAKLKLKSLGNVGYIEVKKYVSEKFVLGKICGIE